MRLNKYIAHYSTYSRREADKIIQEGKVKIDGEQETNPATQVDEKWVLVYVGSKKIIPNDEYTVIVYNKPKGELVTKNDPRGRRIIYDSLDKKYKHFISVGRLDYASEGLLLLTDSSQVASAMMHSKMERVYRVKIKGHVTEGMKSAMGEGLTIEGTDGAHEETEIEQMTFAPFYAYEVIKDQGDYSILKVVIGEGQNREIRRFFAHFGGEVVDLKRLSFGGISLNNLPTSKTRFLTRGEYNSLHTFMKEERSRNKQQQKDADKKQRRDSYENDLERKRSGDTTLREGEEGFKSEQPQRRSPKNYEQKAPKRRGDSKKTHSKRKK